MIRIRNCASACLVLAVAAACAGPEIHIHDRHGLSYPLIESFAKSHPGATLVLLDRHHDAGSTQTGVTSWNWAGALAAEGRVSRIIWVSGRVLLLHERASRRKWLREKLDGLSENNAADIENRILIEDWAGLQDIKLRGPLIVSLDLDLFCNDPDVSPDVLLDEIVQWTAKQRPFLVTVALSAAYQPEPQTAWDLLERFCRTYPEAGARWYLESGPQAPLAEGLEEAGAWKSWGAHPDVFQRYDRGFRPGAGIWINAPKRVRISLTDRRVRAGDETAREVLSGWSDADRGSVR
jgi:hypothetical protein